jgi:hypothetical protein
MVRTDEISSAAYQWIRIGTEIYTWILDDFVSPEFIALTNIGF